MPPFEHCGFSVLKARYLSAADASPWFGPEKITVSAEGTACIPVVLSGLTERMVNRPPDLRPGLIHAITS